MSTEINWYKADLREMSFVLFEQFKFGELVGREPFAAWGVEEAKAVLQELYRFAKDVLGPLNATGDRQGCHLEAGQVHAPKAFKDAWKQLYEAGFKTVSVKPEHGGQGAPQMLHVLVEEILSGSNAAFNMYPGLASGAAEVIQQCGTPAQAQRFVEKMFTGQWGGTMCLTEPHAGSDVGAARSEARKNSDGTYRIRGTKIFITGGDHDLAENIIHLVLARIEGAPLGTKGLALYSVQAADSTRWLARRIERRSGDLDRAQDGHQWIGHLCAELRGERFVHRRSGGLRRERGHEPDVPDDERGANRRRPAGACGRILSLSECAGVRERAQARIELPKLEGSDQTARPDHRAPGYPPHAAGHEGARRGDPRPDHQAGISPGSRDPARRGGR